MSLAAADYRNARYGSAVAHLRRIIASDAISASAVALLARIHLKTNAADALESLTTHASSFRSNLEKGEASLLRGIAYVRLGDSASAKAQFALAEPRVARDETLSAELTYHRAGAAWIERRLPAATKALAQLPGDLEPDLDLHVRILRGAIASAAEDLTAQGAILLDARAIAPLAGTLARGVLVSQLASLAEALPSDELRDAAVAGLGNTSWPSDIGGLHFDTLRSLAWRHALDGDEFNAFRRLKEAVAVTPSVAWRVAALADRSYLAGALGERRWAAQERRDAHELAATVDWQSLDGEEMLALPQLAVLFADHDPAVAIRYVSTFLAVGKNFARVLSSHRDARVDAVEAYSLGCVQAAVGEKEEAIRLLRRAHAIYERMGIVWRDALVCFKLAELEDAERWRSRGEAAIAHYPRSWLARRTSSVARGIVAAPSVELAMLTPAQRRVFEELMNGRNTAEIAETLGRSAFTIRNHIKAIFKAFDVSSRPALLAKASSRT